MFLVNYYRITKKLRNSKAAYGNLMVDDIIAVNTYIESSMFKFNVYVLDGDEYYFVCDKWIKALGQMISKKDDDGSVYQVEEIYPPEAPTMEEAD